MTGERRRQSGKAAIAAALATLPSATTGAVLIHRHRLGENYRALCRLAAPAQCAPVVKADAYGLGVANVMPELIAAGAASFFVATVGEGQDVRRLAPAAAIYVLGGLPPGSASAHAAHRLRPVLNSLAELEEWDAHCRTLGQALPAAIHVDTGINRLGMPASEARQAATRPLAFEVALVMSHLACADVAGHALTDRQLTAFEATAAGFPGVPRAIASSAGAIVTPASRLDLVRPGIALYGCRVVAGQPAPYAPVVAIMARVLQLRDIAPGDSVGYGASAIVPAGRPQPLAAATLGIGYADGLPRSAGGTAGSPAFVLRLPDGSPAPLLGRVSMDSCVIDVSAAGRHGLARGDWVTIAGLDPPSPSIDDLADASGTIGHEILSRLGPRLARVLIDSEEC